MEPILARYGPFFLYSYSVVMGVGILAGLGLMAWLDRRETGEHLSWLDGLLAGMVAALVGGRLAFVWANWSYFQGQAHETWLVWRGGLSYHGALLVGLLAFGLWSFWRGRTPANDLGLLAPALALVSASGWFACWLEGCAYGRETVYGFLAADLPDSFGVFALRYQTQLLGVILSLVALALILALRRRARPGQLFWFALLLLSAGRLAVSLLRGDAMPLLGTFRLDTILELALVIIALTGMAVGYWRARPAKLGAGHRQPQ
jgi:phosphatidylglycerol:prolipoprotein diacylglycerol transferase